MKDVYRNFGLLLFRKIGWVFLLTFFLFSTLQAQIKGTANTGHGISLELVQAGLGRIMLGWERYSTSRWSTQVKLGYAYRAKFMDEVRGDVQTNLQEGYGFFALHSKTEWGGQIDFSARFRIKNWFHKKYSYIGIQMGNAYYDFGPEIDVWVCDYNLCAGETPSKRLNHPKQLERTMRLILGIKTNPFGRLSLELEVLSGIQLVYLLNPSKIDPIYYNAGAHSAISIPVMILQSFDLVQGLVSI